MTDPGVDRIKESIARVSPDTAVRFAEVSQRLMSLLEPEEYESWASCCGDIANSGWRSFEAVNTLLDISERLAVISGGKGLLKVGEYGLKLTGYSFDPPLRYFEGVEELITRQALDRLAPIERGGAAIRGKYEHASGLIADYFETAFDLGGRLPVAEIEHWTDIVCRFAETRRDYLTDLLAHSRSSNVTAWASLSALQQRSVESCVAYVRHLDRLAGRLQPKVMARLDQLILSYPEPVSEGALTALESVAHRTTGELLTLIDLANLLSDFSLFELLIRKLDELPIDNPALITRWLQTGLAETARNDKATRAFINLESARSVEVLSSLKGQVDYSDWQRVFQLITEAFAPHAVKIETAVDVDGFRGSHLPGTDGRMIYLPASVSTFDDHWDNFGFYKVSLLHQLGYFEFGCIRDFDTVLAFLSAAENRELAERIFCLVEDARIDWQLTLRFPGVTRQMIRQKDHAALMRSKRPRTREGQLLEVLVLIGLDAPYTALVDDRYHADADRLRSLMARIRRPGAAVQDTIEVARDVCRMIQQATMAGVHEPEPAVSFEDLPEPVSYRGQLDVGTVNATLKIETILEAIHEHLEEASEEDMVSLSQLIDPDNLDLSDIKKGEVSEGLGVLISELQNEVEVADTDDAGDGQGLFQFLGGISSRIKESSTHVYDEWDYEIGDYRPRWCTLYELRDLDEDEEYVFRTLNEHRDLSRRVRGQLNKVRPEMLRKVKGVPEGEELDLERSVAFHVDRKAGLTPDENIYVQRQRRERDVSTLFLLDMSASTDDIIADPDEEPKLPVNEDNDEVLFRFFEERKRYEAAARRIIDLEKQSVVLMAEALEKLGDSYSVCGFSGYGRDQVDYYLCKDFDDPYDARARGKIGGIKPCRSTRMGPPIRHATRQLLETGSRVKALIIISDGYPQDHDYGADRNSRDYGLMDTMKALTEAKQQGVLTFCLTVDPSGHDYLRAMCPDSQYMVIQEIEQLPEELSRVYRSLTG